MCAFKTFGWPTEGLGDAATPEAIADALDAQKYDAATRLLIDAAAELFGDVEAVRRRLLDGA